MTPLTGLSAREVAERQAKGEVNKAAVGEGRSYSDIIRGNLFTFFNNTLYVIGGLLIALGQVSDAIFSAGLGLLNALIGTFQEVRSKRQLDQIALLNRPEVTVLRDATEQIVDPEELVVDDIIRLRAGDQVVVDGSLVGSGVVEVDESLLTGEADLIRKQQGDPLLSGSFCVTGDSHYKAEKVGADSFANQLTAAARSFELTLTPLQDQVNFIVKIIMLIVALMSVVFAITAIVEAFSFARVVELAAVLTGLVPYGLFTMIVVAYATGAVTIAQRGALVQQTNAIESLSNVDVLCMDKTGTLTANRIEFNHLMPLEDISREEATDKLARYSRSVSEKNKTSDALADALPGEAEHPLEEIPFASARKWSALAFDDGVYVLGAIEMLLPFLPVSRFGTPAGTFLDEAKEWSDQGLRVLLFAFNPDATTLYDDEGAIALPLLQPMALINLKDELRPFAAETLSEFKRLGIQLKIISGDNPRTVAALAQQAGLAGDLPLVSGPELAEMSDPEIAVAARDVTVFGRISPAQKEALVDHLLQQGNYVAMMGDGVNDVLSLKKARVGIAMQSGSQAARNVADIVLLKDSFAALSPALQEGKRIVNGLTSSIFLFLVRVVASAMLIIGISMIGLGFPFEPSQVSLTLFTVGIPSLFLTMWAPPIKPPQALLRSLIRFVMPASIITMLVGITIYTVTYSLVLARLESFTISPRVVAAFEAFTGLAYNVDDGFTAAAATIAAQTLLSDFISFSAFFLILFLVPPNKLFTGWTTVASDKRPVFLTLALCATYIIIIQFESLAAYFSLLKANGATYITMLIALPIWWLLLKLTWQNKWFERLLGLND